MHLEDCRKNKGWQDAVSGWRRLFLKSLRDSTEEDSRYSVEAIPISVVVKSYREFFSSGTLSATDVQSRFERLLLNFLVDFSENAFDVDRLREVRERKRKRDKATLLLREAALLENLPENYYETHQPTFGFNPNNLLIPTPPGLEHLREEWKLEFLGARGGASRTEGARRALFVKVLAAKLPLSEMKSPNASIAKLGELVGLKLSPAYVRSVRLKGRT